eukprot:5850118-Amphidinium_carterae.1
MQLCSGCQAGSSLVAAHVVDEVVEGVCHTHQLVEVPGHVDGVSKSCRGSSLIQGKSAVVCSLGRYTAATVFASAPCKRSGILQIIHDPRECDISELSMV